jgi:hypothetical protein
MKCITVLVKGNRYEAARHAAIRRIPFAFQSEKFNETTGHVPVTYEQEVRKWFGEDLSAPFPIGTCLWFRTP